MLPELPQRREQLVTKIEVTREALDLMPSSVSDDMAGKMCLSVIRKSNIARFSISGLWVGAAFLEASAATAGWLLPSRPRLGVVPRGLSANSFSWVSAGPLPQSS